MKLLALLFLFALPQAHVEHGRATIGKNGEASVKFKKYFDALPTCTVTGGKAKTYSREWILLVGKPGSRVTWECK